MNLSLSFFVFSGMICLIAFFLIYLQVVFVIFLMAVPLSHCNTSRNVFTEEDLTPIVEIDLYINSYSTHNSFHRSDEGLTLETSAFKLFTVANTRYQLSFWYSFVHMGEEKHCESKVSCLRRQHSDPDQGSNPDHWIWSQAH